MLTTLFNNIDKNKDGVVTRAEIIVALRNDQVLQKLLDLPAVVG